jgi:outer membrane protein assembly factor BamA
MRRAALWLLLGFIGAAPAQEPELPPAPGQGAAPVIREIVFRGNETTEPVTMLREMPLHVGDPAEPRAVERSRQGVQDLGLFRDVEAELEPVEGGVRLVVTVKEKYYILPFPRADATSDGGYAYGAQLTWNNVWGLNHTFRPYFERRQPSEGDDDPEKRGVQTRAQIRYSAPFIFGKFGLDLGAGYFRTPYLEPLEYEQTTTFYTANLTRKLSGGARSQGWTGVTGLTLANESHTGADAPTDPLERERGQALALLAGAYYRDLRFNVYSDEGVVFGVDVQGASPDVASDYDFVTYGLNWYRYLNVGATPHQNLNLQFDLRARHDGRYGGDFYAIGGVETVRGFEPETQKGDAYYAASIEYLHPVIRNSIRGLIVLDAANAFPDANDMNVDKVYTSLGLGMRFRIQAFVALDLELGVAWPLNGGGPRVFASKVN